MTAKGNQMLLLGLVILAFSCAVNSEGLGRMWTGGFGMRERDREGVNIRVDEGGVQDANTKCTPGHCSMKGKFTYGSSESSSIYGHHENQKNTELNFQMCGSRRCPIKHPITEGSRRKPAMVLPVVPPVAPPENDPDADASDRDTDEDPGEDCICSHQPLLEPLSIDQGQGTGGNSGDAGSNIHQIHGGSNIKKEIGGDTENEFSNEGINLETGGSGSSEGGSVDQDNDSNGGISSEIGGSDSGAGIQHKHTLGHEEWGHGHGFGHYGHSKFSKHKESTDAHGFGSSHESGTGEKNKKGFFHYSNTAEDAKAEHTHGLLHASFNRHKAPRH